MSWWDFGESQFEKDVRASLNKLYKEVLKMSKEMDKLNAEVQELIVAVKAERDVVDAATMAIKGLTDQQAVLVTQLQEALDNGDPLAIQAAADAIDAQNNEIIAQTAALAAAIPANTNK